jgi:hypothetical protein
VISVLRTVLLRNFEIVRRVGRQVRQGWPAFRKSVGGRVSALVQAARKPVSRAWQAGRGFFRVPGSYLDKGLLNLEQRLKTSDLAVVLFSLALIVACVVLTVLAVGIFRR